MKRHLRTKRALSIIAIATTVGICAAAPSSATAAHKKTAQASSAPAATNACATLRAPNDRSELAGEVCFVPTGDRFFIRDLKADGLGLRVDASVNRTGEGLRCTGLSASVGWASCSYAQEVPENARLLYVLQLVDGNKVIASSHAYGADATG